MPPATATTTPTPASTPLRTIQVIIIRLIVLVAAHYILLSAAFFLLVAPYTAPAALVLHVFDPSLPSFAPSRFDGIMASAAYLISAALLSPAVSRVARRSAKCADFSVSVYLIHAGLTWYVHGRFPTSGAYWTVMVLCGALCSLLSERLAMREELKEIDLGSFVASKQSKPAGVLRVVSELV